MLLGLAVCAGITSAVQAPPALTGVVNDFAGVIGAAERDAIEATARALEQATGDIIVVSTVETTAPSDIQSYAVEMFENAGRGIGAAGDNGLLVLLAVKDRQVRVEVGYGLEPFITDGFAGETSRRIMAPEFREGRFGAGLAAGVAHLARRIAERRGVELTGVPRPAPRATRDRDRSPTGLVVPIGWVVFLLFYSLVFRRRRRRRRWGGHWSGWSSGVGPFGGGFGGGFGGRGMGGFGGGFGGFGGGRSGGGGGGASW